MADVLKVVTDEERPGVYRARVLVVDDRINIDDYDPKHPDVLWFCDHCGAGHPVTAEFHRRDGEGHWTLCADCLQKALNGIAVSLANPVNFDDPEYAKAPTPAEPTP